MPKTATKKRIGVTYIDDRGYLRYEDTGKLVHRRIMERHIGRKLYFNGLDDPKSEVVHHIDYDKLNNRLSNLRLMTNTEHAKLHKKDMEPRKSRVKVLIEIAKGILVPKGKRATKKQANKARRINRKNKRKFSWNHKIRAKRKRR